MQITVTLAVSHDQRGWRDVELPNDVPVRQLTSMVAQVLDIQATSELPVQYCRPGGDWTEVKPSQSLEAQDIWDGAYLRFQTEVPQLAGWTNDSVAAPVSGPVAIPDEPIVGWKPLFDTPSDSFAETAEPADDGQRYVWKILD